jgi:large subunit ribosomal protein L6|uniref:Ribosomal protein L6 n=1 Tax=Fistulifera solaris TaxID=1519565 RepID=A0A0U2JTG9_FISSO|nr:ribosomal protein L6 [Fistulifera solaris]ALG35781.1 ribosomal protein L6 [Fistulifera solaris]
MEKTHNNKYIIKIPSHITILYLSDKNILTVIGPLKRKSLKLELKVFVSEDQKTIVVSSEPCSKISNKQKKNINALKGTTAALIKQVILETSYLLYQKLKFVGIGYRTFDVDNFENRLLMFRLGYSHPIFFKINEEAKIFCLKRIKLFIYGNSYQNITQTAALIRSYKKPEPYKGKGILYENEKINIKEGKKV